MVKQNLAALFITFGSRCTESSAKRLRYGVDIGSSLDQHLETFFITRICHGYQYTYALIISALNIGTMVNEQL